MGRLPTQSRNQTQPTCIAREFHQRRGVNCSAGIELSPGRLFSSGTPSRIRRSRKKRKQKRKQARKHAFTSRGLGGSGWICGDSCGARARRLSPALFHARVCASAGRGQEWHERRGSALYFFCGRPLAWRAMMAEKYIALPERGVGKHFRCRHRRLSQCAGRHRCAGQGPGVSTAPGAAVAFPATNGSPSSPRDAIILSTGRRPMEWYPEEDKLAVFFSRDFLRTSSQLSLFFPPLSETQGAMTLRLLNANDSIRHSQARRDWLFFGTMPA